MVDPGVKIDVLAGVMPGALGDLDKFVLERSGNRPGPGERLEFPSLGSASVVRLVGLERADERPLFSFRTEPGVNSRKISLRAGLCDSGQKFLRRAILFSHKKDIEIGAIAEFASA